MTVEIRLFGFGKERPERFAGTDRLDVEVVAPATPRAVLKAAGVEIDAGLLLWREGEVIPPWQWDEALVEDRDCLTLMSAVEGG